MSPRRTSGRARLWPLVVVIAAAGLAPERAAHARRDLEQEVVRAARYLGSWRFEEARELIDKLSAAEPDAVETRYLRAELAFLDGSYPRALELIEGLRPGEVGGNVGALRALAQSTLEATKGFATARSSGGHFLIAYPPGKDEAIVELTGDVLESAYRALNEDLGYRAPGPVRVELLSAPADLARVSTLTEKEIETTGTIALCKYGKLMVVTPRATVFGYPWMDTMVHEYVHYVVSRMSHDRVPVWLQEGLARFEQVRWRGPATRPLSAVDEFLLAGALKGDDLISFDDMHPSMAKLPSQKAAALAFAEVATMVAYLHQEAGYEGLRKVVAQIKTGKNARKAVADVMDAKWDSVERGWKQYLRAAKLRSTPALAGRAQARRIRFKKGEGEDENVGADEVASARARKFTRLGGLLRARGLSQAAAAEYEKALAVTGPTDPFVAGKLSRTYLELESYDRAIELARPLLALDETDAAPASTLGTAYLATGKPKDAADAFEMALRVSPFDPAVRCGLADAYEKLARAAEAAREQRACELVR
ncbi:MAG TPA: tetratricopeptide repeat protein [Kofleriaceae bacterium]|nr:tetratricopeptide repeat protein [Kofleriaceae bacterium]